MMGRFQFDNCDAKRMSSQVHAGLRRAGRVATATLLVLALAGVGVAQQSSPSGTTPGQPATTPSAIAPPPQTTPESNQAFLSAADEVLSQMSKILDLPIKEPLKKSLRSRQEIRAYLIQEEKDDKDEAQRYADEKSLEAFGLIPKDFPLDSFMIDLLTDQVAGMYDPKEKEFYIADWIPIADQREVMAHELTHALEDQSFHIEGWIKAARPNDDAEMARDAVSEGSALAAMVDYVLRDEHVSVRELPDVTQLVRTGALAEMGKDSILAKAPLYIRDSLMFPYLEGTSFCQQFLKAHTGWEDLTLLFENPPVSTQQILHPDLYLKGVKPVGVTLPKWKGLVPKNWKLLEENVMGEFGLQELLKQFLGEERAAAMAPAWVGDRYAVFENSKTGETPIVFRLKLDNSVDAERFFAEFSEALQKKYAVQKDSNEGPEFLEFHTTTGGVYLRCVAAECLDVEGTTRGTFDSIDSAIGWTPAPASGAAAAITVPGGRPAKTASVASDAAASVR
jgi:hypothetical protein